MKRKKNREAGRREPTLRGLGHDSCNPSTDLVSMHWCSLRQRQKLRLGDPRRLGKIHVPHRTWREL